jgi:nucleotide-binding universal stress UspA family protein
MRVLLAVDGSSCSEAAVDDVMMRLRPEETEVKVLHAVEWMKEMPLCFRFAEGPDAGGDVARYREECFERARRLVDGFASRLELKGFRTSVSCPDADPRHAVIEAAAAWPADLIVVGSHGRRGVDRFLLGSVAESVVRHSPCSVEVVRRQVAA